MDTPGLRISLDLDQPPQEVFDAVLDVRGWWSENVVGDTTTVLTPKPVAVEVVGIATFGELDSLGPTTFTAFTLPQASELFAQRPDTISAVLVAADAGVSRETLRDEIIQKVPARCSGIVAASFCGRAASPLSA